jgi:hypothetical protein
MPKMTHPWLGIPLSDYEAHMRLLGQAQMLAAASAGRATRGA